MRKIALIVVLVLVAGLFANSRRASCRRDEEQVFPQFLEDGNYAQIFEGRVTLVFGPFLAELERRDYPAAFALLHPDLQKAWTQAVFTKEVGGIRDSLGTRWAPEMRGSGVDGSGKRWQAGYQLEADWETKFTIKISAVKSGKTYEITALTFRVPADSESSTLQEAKKQVNNFVELLKQESYEEVKALLGSLAREQMNAAGLEQLRSMLMNEESNQIEVKEQELRMLVAGVWYDTLVISPKADPVRGGRQVSHQETKGMKGSGLAR